MALTDVRDALLLALPEAVYHFEAPEKSAAPYIVWAEDSQGDAQHANNAMIHQAIRGTIDLFTRNEYDPLFQKIQQALTVCHIPFRLNSIQREQETKLIHYEWIFEEVP